MTKSMMLTQLYRDVLALVIAVIHISCLASEASKPSTEEQSRLERTQAGTRLDQDLLCLTPTPDAGRLTRLQSWKHSWVQSDY